jgi:hypothetical protein
VPAVLPTHRCVERVLHGAISDIRNARSRSTPTVSDTCSYFETGMFMSLAPVPLRAASANAGGAAAPNELPATAEAPNPRKAGISAACPEILVADGKQGARDTSHQTECFAPRPTRMRARPAMGRGEPSRPSARASHPQISSLRCSGASGTEGGVDV